MGWQMKSDNDKGWRNIILMRGDTSKVSDLSQSWETIMNCLYLAWPRKEKGEAEVSKAMEIPVFIDLQ